MPPLPEPMEKIHSARLRSQCQPLLHSFGFKGGSLTELWQVTCELTTDCGTHAVGESVQSVLWSDGAVFARWGQDEGNRKMLALTSFALERLRGMPLEAPPDMLKKLQPEVLAYGRRITENDALRTTFALNALTGIDWALWKLYRKSRNIQSFTDLTAPFTDYLSLRQNRLGGIPLLSYNTTPEEIRALADKGYFLFKIKIGSNPGGDNDLETMLRWDIARLEEIHRLLSPLDTPWTQCGHPLYYLDANGRYDTVERLRRFLEAADAIGALERILLLEEPFAENNLQDVRALPVRIAGDESAHSAEDAVLLMEQCGYRAMALKPIAKTVSVSLEVLQAAGERGVPCFCADLTVNPTMVELNKRFAAGLAPLPGLKIGVFESNGAQNYANWGAMCRESPAFGESWTQFRNGTYALSEKYYRQDGNLWKEG